MNNAPTERLIELISKEADRKGMSESKRSKIVALIESIISSGLPTDDVDLEERLKQIGSGD